MGYVLLMNIWSVGQGVKTPPFHGGNTGSNPVRTISHSAIAQLVGQWIEAPCVGGSIPSRAICLYFGRVAKRLNAADCKSAPSGSGVRIPPLP